MLNTLTGVHYLVYYPPITCDRLSSYSEIPSLFVDRFFIFFFARMQPQNEKRQMLCFAILV